VGLKGRDGLIPLVGGSGVERFGGKGGRAGDFIYGCGEGGPQGGGGLSFSQRGGFVLVHRFVSG